MKFSDIDKQQWPELQPYLDTVVLPLTGLSGSEHPWEATEALEMLRDTLYPIESAYKGRIVTYPAVHYAEKDEYITQLVDVICSRLRSIGFTYCIVVAGSTKHEALRFEEVSLFLVPKVHEEVTGTSYRERIQREIEALWYGAKP